MTDTAPVATPAQGAGDASAPQTGTDTTQDTTTPVELPPIDPGWGDDADDTAEGEIAGETIAVTVNGKSYDLTMDQLKAAAQREIAGEGKLEVAKKEIAKAREQQAQFTQQQSMVRSLLQVLANGDFEAIAEFADSDQIQKFAKVPSNYNFKKAAINYVAHLYEQSKMSPEQREGMQAKKEVDRLRRENENRQKTETERNEAAEVARAQQHLDTVVPQVIQQVGLPNTVAVQEYILSTWRAALERGENPTPLQVAQHVKARLDESKLVHKAAPPATRPRATTASIANGRAPAQEGGYVDFSEWQKNRGRR